MSAPAFKEWHSIVDALVRGEQILILRKGGIAEGRGGFQVKSERFWLLPTYFHAQEQKLKSSLTTKLPDEAALSVPPSSFTVRAFAEITAHAFLTDWPAVARLDPFHSWSEATIRERFEWSKPPGVHAFVVRIHRLHEPFSVATTPELAGCKSWVELPNDFDTLESSPAVDDAAFAQRSAAIQSAWSV
jgi:hypothetical protein